MQRSAFDDSLPEAKNNTHALSPKGSSLSSISEQGVDQSVNESPDKDSGELPKGWIAVPSNSRPGQVSYMNIFTQKRQQLKPRQIAPEALEVCPIFPSPVLVKQLKLVFMPSAL